VFVGWWRKQIVRQKDNLQIPRSKSLTLTAIAIKLKLQAKPRCMINKKINQGFIIFIFVI
jgi:hypothetical protein